jgi:hypothetical protein
MQVHHPSINAEPIITKLMYNICDAVRNKFGSEGAFHLSKGKWKNII